MRQGWLDHLMMSCNGKGHSSFAGVKFQVHLIGGKLLPVFQKLCHFQVLSQVAICFLNPKKICCKSIPIVFCLMCEPGFAEGFFIGLSLHNALM